MRIKVSQQQVKQAFEAVKGGSMFEDSGALVAQGKMPLEMIQAFSLRPEILRWFGQSGDALYPGGLVERSVKEFIILESSRRNACQFCMNSHIDFTKSLGIADDPLGALDEPARTERERLAIEYTRAAMTDSNRIPDSLFGRLRQHFSDPEIVELTAMIGFINMLNMFNNCLGVTYHGECALPPAR